MGAIRVRGVTVSYDLLTVADYNLKRQLITGAKRKRVRGDRQVLHALKDIDLNVAEGTRLGLIGSNGAGKSTLLRVLAGALPATRGEVRIAGRLLPLLGGAGAGLESELTGIENILLMGLALGESPTAMRGRIDDIAEFSGLNERLLNPVGTYSSGMSARLRFSVLTTLKPDILIMDEGVATADAEFSARAGGRLQEFMGSAGILVMSSHGPAVTKLCTSAIWLHRGSVVAHGDVDVVYAAYQDFVARQAEEGERGEVLHLSDDLVDSDVPVG